MTDRYIAVLSPVILRDTKSTMMIKEICSTPYAQAVPNSNEYIR